MRYDRGTPKRSSNKKRPQDVSQLACQGYPEVLSHYLHVQTRLGLPYKSPGSVIRRLKPTITEAEHPTTWRVGHCQVGLNARLIDLLRPRVLGMLDHEMEIGA